MEEKTQEVTTQETSRNFDLTSFTRAKEKMVSTNQTSDSVSTLGGRYSWSVRYRKTYTPEEIRDIVEEGSIQAKRLLSNYFFETNGYYRQIILSYVNLLKYSGILRALEHFPHEVKNSFLLTSLTYEVKISSLLAPLIYFLPSNFLLPKF